MLITISTSYGPRLTAAPARPAFPGEAGNALALACTLDRTADLHLAEGRTHQADRLSHLASELRCRALGGRA